MLSCRNQYFCFEWPLSSWEKMTPLVWVYLGSLAGLFKVTFLTSIYFNTHVYKHTVCRVVFARVILAIQRLQTVSPALNSTRHSCIERKVIWDIRIQPVFNSPTDNEGERGENKTGATIFLYTVSLIVKVLCLSIVWFNIPEMNLILLSSIIGTYP